jgi:hypothetical protein
MFIPSQQARGSTGPNQVGNESKVSLGGMVSPSYVLRTGIFSGQFWQVLMKSTDNDYTNFASKRMEERLEEIQRESG